MSRLDLEHLSAVDCGDHLAEWVNTRPYFDNEAHYLGNVHTGYLAGPHPLASVAYCSRYLLPDPVSAQYQIQLSSSQESPHLHNFALSLLPFLSHSLHYRS